VSGPDTLVRMANQIARFFASQPGPAGAAGVADHLRAFWDPTMRRQILAWVDRGGDGLDPLALEGVELLRDTGSGEVRAALAQAGERTARRPGDDAG
jgi:formate dehydrogenase subunit delta